MTITILTGCCRSLLQGLPSQSVHTCVTSPPYWGLRNYGIAGQLGFEQTPADYVGQMVAVFREVRRVLSDDGTLWLNLGDSYAGSGRGGYAGNRTGLEGSTDGQDQSRIAKGSQHRAGIHEAARLSGAIGRAWVPPPRGLKSKDLVGIPWRVAFALQDDGWYLRSDIVWNKPNPMPESVTDRPTKSHEYLFLLSKSERYYYDAEAIREQAEHSSIKRWQQNIDDQEGSTRANGGLKTNGTMKAVGGPRRSDKQRGHSRRPDGFNERWDDMPKAEQAALGRNKRSVWTVATKPFSEAHFATYPPELIEPCILAGSPQGGTILDPFFGAGTTGLVADRLGRNCIGIELNPEYVEIAKRRLSKDAGMFADITAA